VAPCSATAIADVLQKFRGRVSCRRFGVSRSDEFAAVIVRATDGTGNTETPIARSPYPDGSTGYDSIDVTVQRA